MAAVVGHVRECPLLDVKLTLLSHNLVRGAAGAALLNAELLAARGFLDRKSTRLNSSHGYISYAVFCLKKKKTNRHTTSPRNRTSMVYSLQIVARGLPKC